MRHTTIKIGKRAFVRLKDGSKFTDKVLEVSDRFIKFSDRGIIYKNKMKSVSIAQLDRATDF